MPYYAQLNDESIAYAVSELSDVVDSPGLVALPDLDARVLGQRWTGQGWETVEDSRPTLHITLSATLTPVDVPVTWSVAVEDATGNPVPITGTYHVPVFRQDGMNVRLLTVHMADGAAEGNLSLPEPGIYTLDLAKARPVPTARLGAPVELIVAEEA